jgi:hypothetical protein
MPVVAGSAHDDREWLTAEADFEPALDRDTIVDLLGAGAIDAQDIDRANRVCPRGGGRHPGDQNMFSKISRIIDPPAEAGGDI